MIEIVEHHSADEVDSIHVFDTLNNEGLKHTFSDRFPKDYYMMTDWGSQYEQIMLIYKVKEHTREKVVAGAMWSSYMISWECCPIAGWFGGYLLPEHRGTSLVRQSTLLYNQVMVEDFGPNYHMLASTNVHNKPAQAVLNAQWHYAGMVNNFAHYDGKAEHAYVYSYEAGQQGLALALGQLRREHHGSA